MYTGGYVNEFEIVMASENGDLGEVRWTMYLYWVLMILMAIASIKMQLEDRQVRLNAFKYGSLKGPSAGPAKESLDFRTMRENHMNNGRMANQYGQQHYSDS